MAWTTGEILTADWQEGNARFREWVTLTQVESTKEGYFRIKAYIRLRVDDRYTPAPTSAAYLYIRSAAAPSREIRSETQLSAFSGTHSEQTIYFQIPTELYKSSFQFKGRFSSWSAVMTFNCASPCTLTAASVSIGSETTVLISKMNSNFKTVIDYIIENNQNYVNIYSSNGSTFVWQIPDSAYESLAKDSCSVTVTLRCMTYDGSAFIGTTYFSFKAEAETERIAPVIETVTLRDERGLFERFGKFVSGRSKVALDYTGSTRFGAEIVKTEIDYAGRSFAGGESIIPDGEYDSLVFSITDSRGITARQRIEMEIYPYSLPALSGIGVYRTDPAGVGDEDGYYICVRANAHIAPLGGQNVPELTVAVRRINGEYETAESIIPIEVNMLRSPYSPDISWAVCIRLTDSLGESISVERSLTTRAWAMKFRPDGRGVAFGKAAESDRTLELPESWRIKIGAEQLSADDIRQLKALIGL